MRIHLNQSTASVCLPLLLFFPFFFSLLLSPVETNEGGDNPAANASLLDGSATEAAFSAPRLPEFFLFFCVCGRGRLCISSVFFLFFGLAQGRPARLCLLENTPSQVSSACACPIAKCSSERITQGDKSPAAFASPGSATRRGIYTHARTHAHTHAVAPVNQHACK